MKEELIPNKSYSNFILGENIYKYLKEDCFYEILPARDKYENDLYFGDNGIVIATENDRIKSIMCDETCYWQGKNLIGMYYKDFLEMAKVQPDDEDAEYIPVSRTRGQNRKIYYFDSLGLMVWVWRDKIRSVTIDNGTSSEE